jgi:DNA (cytosine-5)-methyltransferase 1
VSGLTVTSLFAGVGGFDLGFQRAGATTTTLAEMDPKAQGVLRRHFPHANLIPDVREVSDVRTDVIAGGFPCQDISVAGKRAGLAGDRSGLWWEFHRIVAESRPRWVLIENVTGLLSSGVRPGSDLGAIIRSLDDIGYLGEWRVLDSNLHGVPQRRRRVFILARRAGVAPGQPVLLEPEGVRGNPSEDFEPGEEAAPLPPARAGVRGQQGVVPDATGTLTARYGGNAMGAPEVDADLYLPHRVGTVTTTFGPKNYCNTQEVTSGSVQPVHDGGEWEVRRLSPVETERLQGFPDDWTRWDDKGREITQGHRIRFMGNAVTVPVVEAIARRIVSADQEHTP